jgi:hypothetical protein
MPLMNLVFKRIDSPVGLLKLVANEASLAAILWENDSRAVFVSARWRRFWPRHTYRPSGS